MISSVESFNRAMTLWFELTGMDPNANSWKMSQWELRTTNEELKESMEYDPSLITTYLLLDAFSTDYFKQAKISVAEFDDDPDKIFSYMEKVKEFKGLIRSPEIVAEAEAFVEATRLALLHYDVSSEATDKFLSNRFHLAFIRRDALKSINRLRADQFLQGNVDPDGTVPIYNREVFGYWNINSMINHVCDMPSGMSLNLIRDPDELHSYFSFAIRNGGNLIVLTDIQEYAHPLGRYMSRCPDRAFSDRSTRNWFPYELLNIQYNEEGDPYHDAYRESLEKGLVPYQAQHFVLAKLADLEIPVVVWTSLMFDLIQERYWKSPIPQRALSYTNDMIRLENKLIGSAAQSNLPVVGYQPLNLPLLTPADMMTDALDEKALGRKHNEWNDRYGKHRWMEARYGEKVPVEALNQIGVHDGTHLFLSYNPEKPLESYRGSSSVPAIVAAEGEVKRITPGEGYFDRKKPFRSLQTADNPVYELERVDGTLFGTREQIDADRKFIARINFARGIQREADREFNENRDRILKWFKDAAEANFDRVLAYAHFDETCRTRSLTKSFALRSEPDQTLEQYKFSGMVPVKGDTHYSDWGVMDQAILTYDQGYERYGDFFRCHLTGAKPTWKLYILPGSAEDLCLLTGTKFEDLPEYLQNWAPGRDDYIGNTILDRIDPLEWKLCNPWHTISFGIRVHLSKRARARIMKEIPAPQVPDVSNVKRHTFAQNGRNHQTMTSHNNWKAQEYLEKAEREGRI